VWREAWGLLHAQRKDCHAELREQVLATDLVIECDRFRLVQVFRNILDNALSACPDPVEIEITCELTHEETNPPICVRVRDNGPGLNAEQRRRIFEPFYTTKPTGTGLGMAITQRIIEAHGGIIAIGDDRSSGAEIIVTLPRKSQLS
jgi:signal transduction histidine kinase